MSFELRNARATYQWLVNKMFVEYLGDTIEVYIEDMLVKFLRAINYILHLEQAFMVLDSYQTKLNSKKYPFCVLSRLFLVYLVTQWGIKAHPGQIKAILNMPHPSSIKEVQRLPRQIATLSRFISYSINKCMCSRFWKIRSPLNGWCIAWKLLKIWKRTKLHPQSSQSH